MKKAIIFAMMAGAVGAGAMAQSKFDGTAAQYVNAAQSQVLSRGGDYRPVPSDVIPDGPVTVIVTVTDGNVLSQLEKIGCEVRDQRGDMFIVSATPDQLVTIAELSDVLNISLGYEARPLLNTARAATHVDEVHAGTGLDKAYDGSGVIVGMMDTGFDPNHSNFLDEDGNQRISKFWVITGNNGAVREYSGETLLNYTTDTSTQTHGTHVLGIMAGGYKGLADQVAIVNARGNSTTKRNYAVPYYGVATGAEITPCVGTLTANNISDAMNKVLGYAQEQGKPAVMNLSLGHNYGPHDGQSAAGRYFAEVGKDMIICVSSGNEAGRPMSIQKQFTTVSQEVKTMISQSGQVSGIIDIWSGDDTPFDFSFIGVKKSTGEIVYSYDFNGSISGSTTLTGSGYFAPGYITDSKLDAVFGSKAVFQCTIGVNSLNNRFNVLISNVTTLGSGSEVVPGILIKGTPSKKVYMYAGTDYINFYDNGLSGFTLGNDLGSINDMACADNIISVGAYVSSAVWPTLGGNASYGSTKGDIADFSSYGARPDGVQLPIVLGPGEGIVSSYSNYYMAAGNDIYNGTYVVARKDAEKRSDYWEEMSGTSMASPFVAGVIALWLEANPDLTIDQVKSIIKSTSTSDSFTEAKPERSGCGKIDALAGIKAVLNLSGVSEVAAENKVLVSEVAKGVFDVFVSGASAVEASLYSTAGACVANVRADGESATLSAEGLTPGVYVLRVSGGNSTDTRKLVIR